MTVVQKILVKSSYSMKMTADAEEASVSGKKIQIREQGLKICNNQGCWMWNHALEVNVWVEEV